MSRKKKATDATGAPAASRNGIASKALLRRAEEWAVECGLRGPFRLGIPEKVAYPQYGFGYVVLVTEENPHKPGAKVRMGSARFNEKGERTMWTLDGSVVL